jgi:hypothetical protein
MSYSENTSTPVGFSTSTRLPLKISLKLNSFSPKRKLQGKAQRQLKRSNFKSIFLLDIIQLSLDPAINFYTFHSLLNCRNTTNNDFINWLFELRAIQTAFTKKKKNSWECKAHMTKQVDPTISINVKLFQNYEQFG